MDYRVLDRSELSEIVDKAIETVYSGGVWRTAFPDVAGYKVFFPEGYEDMEENPDTFRGVDHAIAHQTVMQPELHLKVMELVRVVTVGNVIGDEVILANIFEHAGTCYAVELALCDKQYVKQYADFLLTNDMYFERFQHFDFVRIVSKWGWCSETYYLLFAHMFTENESFHEDVNYLNFNGHPLNNGFLDDQEEADKFLKSLGVFLTEIAYDIEKEARNTYAAGLFGKLVGKHIYADDPIFPEEKEKSEAFKNRYHELVEKLLHREVVVELPKETDINAAVDIFQQYDDDDIPEI